MYETTMYVIPVSEIFEKYALDRKNDFLSVDTEDYNLVVIKSNSWSK